MAGVVEPPVPAPGQPVDLALARGYLDRRGPVVGGEGVPAGKPGHVADVADDAGSAAATSADYALLSPCVHRSGYGAPQRGVCDESFACYVLWQSTWDMSRLLRSWNGPLVPRLPFVISENVAKCLSDLQVCPSRLSESNR